MHPRNDLRACALGHALRRRGWSVMIVPKQLGRSQRRRLFRIFGPDLLLFQTCRHPLNVAEHAMGHPWVLDLDDADFFDEGLRNRMEQTAAGAAGVVAGSRFIRDWARGLNPRVRVVRTGTPQTAGVPPGHASRPRIVAWAQSGPLGYPAEMAFVADIQRRLLARGESFRLRLYGAGSIEDAARLRAAFEPGSDLELLPFLTYRAFLASLREVAVGLSPIVAASPFSRGKSFGKVLGYLDAGVPVVCSDEADHALFFTKGNGVVSNDPAVWVEAVARLLNDPEGRDAMAAQATRDFRARLTIDVAADLTDRFLRDLLGRPAAPPAHGTGT